MTTVKATIYFEERFWVGTFERTDKEGYAVARHIFGAEPSDAEIYEFVLTHYLKLKFGSPQEFVLKVKRMNPKRVQRTVSREMEQLKKTTKPTTMAQDYMRIEQDKKKKERKIESKAAREEREQQQFQLKQQKRKEKHKGH